MTVANTSIEIYHAKIKGSKEDSQDNQVLKSIIRIGKPCSAKMIEKESGLPLNVVTRCLNNLWSGANKKTDKPFEPKIEKYLYIKCAVTGNKAQHYRIIVKEVQTKLF